MTIGPDKKRCGSPRLDNGQPCGNPAGARTSHLGFGPCWRHGGRLETVAKHWRAVKAEAEAQDVVAKFGWDPIVDPYPVLADILGEAVALKDYLRGRVDELQSLDVDLYGESGKVAEQLKAIVQAYERALDRVERFAAGIAKLDLTSRALAFREALDAALYSVIEACVVGALSDAGLTAEVRGLVLGCFAERLQREALTA